MPTPLVRTSNRNRGGMPGRRRAFTLLEVMVSSVVLSVILVVMLGVINLTSRAMRTGVQRADAFQASRSTYDLVTRRLSEATLNTYWEYYDANGNPRTPANAASFQPDRYGRASDLHFLIEPNAPNGQAVYFQSPQAVSTDSGVSTTQGLLNSCAYFVEFGDETGRRPEHLPGTGEFRYRLMQVIEPTEELSVFADTGSSWTDQLQNYAWPVARNVIALIVWPRLPAAEDPVGSDLTSDYLYDSREDPGSLQFAQLPPAVQITMVVIDEESAIRLENGSAEPTAIRTALEGKFTDVLRYEDDLDDLRADLTNAGIGYRILNRTVMMKGAKWSTL